MQAVMSMLKLLKAPLLVVALGVMGCAAPFGAPLPKPNQAMVAAADPRAVAAGVAMLEAGGGATDAAIATMLVLGLVEPQSAGIGGGGYMLHFDAATKRVEGVDARETAPAGITPALFLDKDGKPIPFGDGIDSGLSTGAPGLVAGLHAAHVKFGKLPWARLFEPAIKLAEEGFAISPRLRGMLEFANRSPSFIADPAVRAYFFDGAGQLLPVGFIRTNLPYAASLRAIAAQGPQALTQGPIAEEIIRVTQRAPRGGALTLQDLQNYAPRITSAPCRPFRAYQVCGMPPSTSGGVAVLSILNLYERARPKPEGKDSLDDWSAYLWASRLAYVDRDHYVADDALVPVPVMALLNARYLDVRAKEIDLAKAAPVGLQPGDPGLVVDGVSLLDQWGRDRTPDNPGTTHLSVTDQWGNAVALTASVESVFGNKRMAGGFFLNNQLTDFAFAPTKNGKPVANAPAPGKRPRSSMAPTIVLNAKGEVEAVLGSPGGSGIIAYVAKTIIAMIDWGMSPQDAVALVNLVGSRPQIRIEPARMPAALSDGLKARGWVLQDVTIEASGVHLIRLTPTGAIGAADPRREGVARSPSGPIARAM
jgi:gamma-glutamyltranspeptidase / glutathione hydrolase